MLTLLQAAILINSLVNLQTYFYNIRDGINKAFSYVLADVGVLVDAFSPIKQDILDQKALNLALDGIQLGLTLAVAPTL